MDKLEYYRNCVQTLLENESKCFPEKENVETALCFDTKRDHYQIMRIGWKDLIRVYHTAIHFNIKEGKIWLQQNTTDIEIAEELVEMGIPREDIVLGIHPPYKRPYTKYGIG